jgi:CRP-like cAMP-binding protein
VIREGDPGERFFVLETGSVDVSRDGEFVRTLSAPGDGFGEIALLRNVPRTATVTATSETQLLGIGRTEFLAAVTGQPVVSTAAARIVDAYLDHDSGRLAGDPAPAAPSESAPP